ncbi:M3 family metallopeptidase [Xylella fastidiosa]|uniref:M3 family metallopeptidase n=1 Tax=Xylella fastidiosa TaxID=2371 RepID=UPI003CE44B06
MASRHYWLQGRDLLFHEFGHALHGMFRSEVSFVGRHSTSRDFVEFPSQFNEHWASDPKVFSHYAKHYQPVSPCREFGGQYSQGKISTRVT